METHHPLEKPANCSLSNEELDRRIAWIRSELLPHLLREQKLGTKRVWELENAPGLAEKLDHWSALERGCCADHVFERVPSGRPCELRFEIRAKAAPPRRWQRFARLGALGTAGVLGVCCGLPLLATALLNGAAAAGLARLDPAWAIGFGALAVTSALFWWQRRRARTSGCGCSQASP